MSEFKTLIEIYDRQGVLIDGKQFLDRDSARAYAETRAVGDGGKTRLVETRRKHKGAVQRVHDLRLRR